MHFSSHHTESGFSRSIDALHAHERISSLIDLGLGFGLFDVLDCFNYQLETQSSESSSYMLLLETRSRFALCLSLRLKVSINSDSNLFHPLSASLIFSSSSFYLAWAKPLAGVC
jgi:hypothetical protein